MLTPGEFVVNRKSAENFGYGNLKKINRYAKGGVAATGSVQYLAGGSGSADIADRKAIKAAEQAEKATEKATEKMNALTDVVGNSIGALGGFTVALTSMDFSSPQAAMASLMSLSFAISQAQLAMQGLATLTKLNSAATIAHTTSTAAGTVANKASTVSEWAETSANLAAAKKGFGKGMKEGFGNIFGSRRKTGLGGGTKGKGMIGGIEKLFRGLRLRSIKGGVGGGAGTAAALQSATGVLAKVGPVLGKLTAGGIVGGIAASLIGPIGNSITDGFLGAKIEIAPGITGRKGVSAEEAGLAGGAVGAAQGAAMGAAIGGAVAGPLAPLGIVIGGLTGALAGFVTGQKAAEEAQDKFNAFEKLQESSSELSKTFQRLVKLGDDIGPASLGGGIEKAERTMEELMGFFDRSMIVINEDIKRTTALSNLPAPGDVGGGSANMGPDIGEIREGEGDRIAKSLMLVSDQINPEDLKAAATILHTSLSNIASDMGALDKVGSLDKLANLDIEDLDQSMGVLNATLMDAESGAGKMGKTLSRFIQISLKTEMFKGIGEEMKKLEGLGDKKGLEEMGVAWDKVQQKLKKDFGKDWDSASLKQIDKAMESITDPDTLKKFRDLRDAGKERVVGLFKEQGVMELVERGARQSRKALDALAAGLEQFGSKTTGIADQVSIMTSQIQDEFAQITGEKTIGKFEQFNPFENPAAASNQQIDDAVNQLASLGGGQDAKDSFRGMAELAKAQRELPLILTDVVSQLTMGRKGEEEIKNVTLIKAIEEALKLKGINLPPQALKSLTSALSQGGDRQTGKAFSIAGMRDAAEKDGKILAILGKVAEVSTAELSRAFQAVGKFKNSILAVAKLNQEMAKHRMASELKILDKQEAIRDRINNALGTTIPTYDALDDAVNDLTNRMKINIGGGVDSPTPFAGNIKSLIPSDFFSHLDQLDSKRDSAQKRMNNLTQRSLTTTPGGGAEELTKEMVGVGAGNRQS